MSAAALTLQNMIPLPNTGTGQTSNYFASVPYYFKRDMVDGKVNWTPNAKANVFGKYSVMIAPVTSARRSGEALGGYPGGAAGAAGIGTGHNKTDVFGGGVSYVITPNAAVRRKLRRNTDASRYDRVRITARISGWTC